MESSYAKEPLCRAEQGSGRGMRDAGTEYVFDVSRRLIGEMRRYSRNADTGTGRIDIDAMVNKT
jgi:hypothetical protein